MSVFSDVVACEIKHWSNFEIISMFYFRCDHGLSSMVFVLVFSFHFLFSVLS